MQDNNNKSCCGMSAQDLMWWMKLLVAVLVVPSIGVVVASMIPVEGLGQIAVFILACWASVFLGMKLMQSGKLK